LVTKTQQNGGGPKKGSECRQTPSNEVGGVWAQDYALQALEIISQVVFLAEFLIKQLVIIISHTAVLCLFSPVFLL